MTERRRTGRQAGVVVLAIAALSACAPFQDSEPNAQIEAVFPPPPAGAQLIDESFQDGRWRGDQPPPAIDRRWLVDCATAEADVAAIEQHFLDEGFVEEVDPNFSVLRYRRQSDDLRAGVESEGDSASIHRWTDSAGLDRDEVEGRCLIWTTVQMSG